MEEFDVNDEWFYKTMQKSNLVMPFSDFEDKVMHRINVEAKHKISVLHNLQLSIIFFVLGTIFGLVLTLILPYVDMTLLGISLAKFALPLQFIFIVIFLSQIENMIKLIKHYR